MNKNNQNGVTLISLVVSIIIMLILTSVTVTTSFTAYENAKAEKLKAQLKAVEEAYADFLEGQFLEKNEKKLQLIARVQEKEQLESKLNLLREKSASGTYTYTYSETQQMQSLEDKISEYTDVENDRYLVFIDDYDNLQRTDKLYGSTGEWEDFFIEDQFHKYGYPEDKSYVGIAGITHSTNENVKSYFGDMTNWSWDDWWNYYEKYYPEVIEQVKLSWQTDHTVPNPDDKSEYYINFLQESLFYNFSSAEIEKVFGLKDIDISVNIDVFSKVVLLSKPEKIDGEKIYSLRQLDPNSSHGTYRERSPIRSEKIRIDKIANYGTSQKIKLSLNDEDIEYDSEINNYTDFKIRKAYYKTKKDDTWFEVDTLRECEYSEDGKSVTFIVYESGDYQFRIEDTSGATCIRMEQFTKFNIRTASTDDPANYEEITDSVNDGYYNIILCNAPQLTSDMIPIKWIYEDESLRNGFWVVCTTIDPEWYNYSEMTKMWANAMFKKDSGKGATGTFTVGEQVAESMLGSTFVWVPRYTSRIDASKPTKLGYNVQFVKDTSNTTTFGTNAYGTNLEIPIAFRNNSGKAGSWDAELKGLWFGKYDAGLEVEEITYGYGGSYSVKNVMWDNNGKYDDTVHYFDKFYKDNQNFHAVSKPYHVAWSYLNFSSAFTQALMFYRNVSTLNDDKTANINSHMMKSTEYDVLQNITREPKTGTTNLKANNSNRYTGGSDGKNGFSVINFASQSSTGNITGIFDIAGTTEVYLSEWELPYTGLSISYSWLLNSNGQFIVQNPDLIGHITAWSGNIDIESEEDMIEFCEKYQNKYFKATYMPSVAFSLFTFGENTSFSKSDDFAQHYASDYTKVNPANYSSEPGFRIIIANSPSATPESFIYTHTNYVPNDESSGFFVTDDFGNVIKTNGEYKDSLGNQTFYPMSQLLDEDYLRDDGEVLKAGSKIDLLKQMTGKLNIALNGSMFAGDPYTDTGLSTIHEIEEGLFSDWNESNLGGKLLKVNLKNATGIKTLGSRVFEDCTDLQEVILPTELEEIGHRTFARCQSLNNVVLPNTLKKIGGTDFTFGSEVNGAYPYSSLVGETFMGCISLTSITIPNNVDIIGCKAFYGCERLSSLNFELRANDRPFIISAHAFAETGITSLTFPYQQNSQIQKGAFANCESLSSIVVYTYGIESLDYAVFANCKNLESFVQLDTYDYGDGCVYLCEDTFNNPSYVTPSGEASLTGAFQNCENLKNIDLSLFGGIRNRKIPKYTFYGCINLGVENVKNIADVIEDIETRAFLNCTNLGKETAPIEIPIDATIGFMAYGSDRGDRGQIFINYAGTYEQWNELKNGAPKRDSRWLSNCSAIITTSDNIVITATSANVGAVVVEE